MVKGCGKEFMNEEKFGMGDGQGYAPQVRRTCGLGAVNDPYLCDNCKKKFVNEGKGEEK